MVAFFSRDSFYKKPFGAVRRDRPVRLRITTPPDLYVYRAELIVNDGFCDRAFPLTYEVTTSDYNAFSIDYTPNMCGTFFYHFKLETEHGLRYIRSFEHSFGHMTDSPENGGNFQLTVCRPSFQEPQGWSGGIIYQIFPDRFCNSGSHKENVPPDRQLRSDWGATPYFLPDEHGRITNNDYFGGDLEGIRQKLDYLREFGVTAIYLNPIFEAHSNHRYNTANYMKIDPLLGTEEDFVNLCADARKKGIRVILDGVFSHTGSDSIYFNEACRYPGAGAANSMDSPYYDWYDFQEWPGRYSSWWGIETLPNVNELCPSYLDFICGPGGVIDTWMERGADGFRLDVADELPDAFITEVRKAVKRHGDDKFLIGEVWEDATNKVSYGVLRQYLMGKELDSVMNYPFKDAIHHFIRYGDSEDFRDRILTICENYPAPALNTAMNSISTHDTARAITVLAGADDGGKGRLWQVIHSLTPKAYQLGVKRLKLAMVLQYTLPGIPCIYYGDEAGLQGYTDPFNRGCYPWGHQNDELVGFAKELGRIRAACPALEKGEIRFLDTPPDVVGYLRRDGEHQCLVYVNTIDAPVDLSLEGPLREMTPLCGEMKGGEVWLKPYGYAILKG